MTDEPDVVEQFETQRRRAFAAADRAGLDRDERLEFAEILLKQDVESWNDLAPFDWQRIVDALDGWHLVDTLHMQRKRSPQSAAETGVVEGEQPPLSE